MSVRERGRIGWDDLAIEIAAIGRLPVERVQPDALLLDDLGFDSLAVAELIVLLLDSYGIAALPEGLETRDWSTVTAGQLFDECGAGEDGA